MAHTYVGPRPVLPQQDRNEWRHNVTGELGTYSNWSLQSSIHLLHGMPINPYTPGSGRHPNDVLTTQMFLGEHSYLPMELAKYSHGGQDAPYLRHAHWEFHGVDSAEVFHAGEWGYSQYDERQFTFSRHTNLEHLGVPSAITLLGGRPVREYGEAVAFHGPIRPYVYQGVGDDRLDDSGVSLSVKYANAEDSNEHAFQRTQEWFGVPSSQAL